MRQARWPTEDRAEADPIDDRCLPGRFQRRLAFAPLPRGLQLRFPFEPDPDDSLDASERPTNRGAKVAGLGSFRPDAT